MVLASLCRTIGQTKNQCNIILYCFYGHARGVAAGFGERRQPAPRPCPGGEKNAERSYKKKQKNPAHDPRRRKESVSLARRGGSAPEC
jgi:hypothetical protein